MENLETHLEHKKKANKIIRLRTLLATGAGFIPFPFLDAAGILGIQLWMLRDLAKLYNIPFKKHLAKSLIGTLISNVSSVGLIKLIPGLGTLLGGGMVAVSGGAATYALGKIFTQHFDQGGTLLSFDPVKSQEYFRQLYEEGKAAVQAQQVGLQDANTQALASTVALKKTNEDLMATIIALQLQLEQGNKNQPSAVVVVPAKKQRRFRWLWTLLFLLLLAAAGAWMFKAGYSHKVFTTSGAATTPATVQAVGLNANTPQPAASDTLVIIDSTQTGKADTLSAIQNTSAKAPATTAGPTAAALEFSPGSSEALIADYMSDLNAKFPKTFSLQAVQFAAGSADLNDGGRQQIGHVAALLLAYPEAVVKIYGHPDLQEGTTTDQQLGKNRAISVEQLLKQQGINSRRMTTASFEAPIAPGSPGGAEMEVMKR